jgi:hypothetical protein
MVSRFSTEPVEKQPKVSQQRIRLWNAIHDFCRQNGGVVVSIPGLKEIRIEVPKDSALPTKLRELGYQPHHHCATTRIAAGAFQTVDVVTITLPGK